MADPLSTLIAELARLPGIGPKTATRLAHHLLRVPIDQARRLAEAVVEVKEKLFHCSLCNAITAEDPCRICSDPTRDKSRICVAYTAVYADHVIDIEYTDEVTLGRSLAGRRDI